MKREHKTMYRWLVLRFCAINMFWLAVASTCDHHLIAQHSLYMKMTKIPLNLLLLLISICILCIYLFIWSIKYFDTIVYEYALWMNCFNLFPFCLISCILCWHIVDALIYRLLYVVFYKHMYLYTVRYTIVGYSQGLSVCASQWQTGRVFPTMTRYIFFFNMYLFIYEWEYCTDVIFILLSFYL